MAERSSTGSWAVAALAVITFAILIGLGTWQVKRLHWKQALVQSIEERISAAPQTIDEIVALNGRIGDVDYVPVTLSGTYNHENEQHFFATHRGASGYYIYTPLRLADDRIVFVNRGFVPFDRKDQATRTQGLVAGPVSITGLARNAPAQKPSSIVPDNDPGQNIFFWKDLSAMAERAGLAGNAHLLPFFVDADDAPNPGGLPVGGVTMIQLPNNHLQYAITWYGLALALAGVVGAWLWSRLGS